MDGRIINTSSVSGLYGNPGQTNYGAAKAGIAAFTVIASLELARYGVTVNAVAPAAVRTPVFDELPADQLEAARARIPVGRFGEPHEVAELVAFLSSDSAAYITGATLDVNGGTFMR